MTKNAPLIVLNVILLLAVAWLLFDRFGIKDEQVATTQGTTDAPVVTRSESDATVNNAIAFFFMDSIQSNYKLITDRGNSFREKGEKLERKLQVEMQRAESRYKQLLEKDHTYSTQAEFKADEAEAQQLVQKIQSLQARSEQELAQLEMSMLEEISNNIITFLEEYNAIAGYDYIFSVQQGGQIWVGNAQQDITRELVDGLNSKYHSAGQDSIATE